MTTYYYIPVPVIIFLTLTHIDFSEDRTFTKFYILAFVHTPSRVMRAINIHNFSIKVISNILKM